MHKTMTSFRLHAAIASSLAALLYDRLHGSARSTRSRRRWRRLRRPQYKESPTQFPAQTPGRWRSRRMRCCTANGGRFTTIPDLNALEDKLNIDNQTIKQYFENFMEARTLIAQARSQLYPTVTVGPSYYAYADIGPCWQRGAVGGRLESRRICSSCRRMRPGNRTCGARCATRSAKRSTTRN